MTKPESPKGAPNPEYLGDGLYVEYDGWMIRLYATNGVFMTNEVFLEPAVLSAFQQYVERIKMQ